MAKTTVVRGDTEKGGVCGWERKSVEARFGANPGGSSLVAGGGACL